MGKSTDYEQMFRTEKTDTVTLNFGTTKKPINITLPNDFNQKVGLLIEENGKSPFLSFIEDVEYYERINMAFPFEMTIELLILCISTQLIEKSEIEESMIEWISKHPNPCGQAKKMADIAKRAILRIDTSILKNEMLIKEYFEI